LRAQPQWQRRYGEHHYGYVISSAESPYAGAQMFEDHRHFTAFPGDSVEIMQRLPNPRAVAELSPV
jgi:hypothetical protein